MYEWVSGGAYGVGKLPEQVVEQAQAACGARAAGRRRVGRSLQAGRSSSLDVVKGTRINEWLTGGARRNLFTTSGLLFFHTDFIAKNCNFIGLNK